LLSEDGSYSGLRAVHTTGDAGSGTLAHKWSERWVFTEVRVHGDRVRVEVEQPPTALYGYPEIAHVFQA
jgi:pyruvate/2-oxoglutarate dehydrogenase complex dihydrolipoamide dehydrogenase (E3) component